MPSAGAHYRPSGAPRTSAAVRLQHHQIPTEAWVQIIRTMARSAGPRDDPPELNSLVGVGALRVDGFEGCSWFRRAEMLTLSALSDHEVRAVIVTHPRSAYNARLRVHKQVSVHAHTHVRMHARTRPTRHNAPRGHCPDHRLCSAEASARRDGVRAHSPVLTARRAPRNACARS
jgi:hypothetical protein